MPCFTLKVGKYVSKHLNVIYIEKKHFKELVIYLPGIIPTIFFFTESLTLSVLIVQPILKCMDI